MTVAAFMLPVIKCMLMRPAPCGSAIALCG
jgi:hypothetical protein